MPEYEREQMANKVLRFYDRLPEEIDRPFTDDFFWEKPGKEMEAVLENPEQTEELLQKMDAALAALDSLILRPFLFLVFPRRSHL